MTHEAKTVLEHYLNVTYASHDTAMVLREAKHALCVLLHSRKCQALLVSRANGVDAFGAARRHLYAGTMRR